MATCPKGHESGTPDYCEVCGSPILGASETPQTAAPAAAESTGSPAPTGPPESTAAPESTGSADESAPDPDNQAPDNQSCPECGTPRSGRFCEVDGHDFLADELGTAQPATPPDTAGPAPAGAGGAGSPAAAGTAWRVTVAADREYHKRVLALGGPDADAMTFPQFCPERQFQLAGSQMLIGRRSQRRGIDPQIDLTGPPEDPGVSHTHAMLVPAADGTWSVVDLDSANGTYLNGATDPITPNTPVALHDGDRVHVGAWTTLTLSKP